MAKQIYKVESLVESGYDFQQLFPEKQEYIAEATGMDFTVAQIVKLLQEQTNNFTEQNTVAFDLDSAIMRLYYKQEGEEKKEEKEEKKEEKESKWEIPPKGDKETKDQKQMREAAETIVEYLPDLEPEQRDEAEAALQYLIDELKKDMESGGLIYNLQSTTLDDGYADGGEINKDIIEQAIIVLGDNDVYDEGDMYNSKEIAKELNFMLKDNGYDKDLIEQAIIVLGDNDVYDEGDMYNSKEIAKEMRNMNYADGGQVVTTYDEGQKSLRSQHWNATRKEIKEFLDKEGMKEVRTKPKNRNEYSFYAKGGEIEFPIVQNYKGYTIEQKGSWKDHEYPYEVKKAGVEDVIGAFAFSSDAEDSIDNWIRDNRYDKGGETDDNWIQEATKEMKKEGTQGLLTQKAKARGLTPQEFAKKILKNPTYYDEKTRKEAQFMKNVNPEMFK